MASPQPSQRPKLSLQTKSMPKSISRVTRMMASADPRDPTSFNTLSNVYVTAIERSTPVQSTPLTAINVKQPLKLLTDRASLEKNQKSRIATPFTANLPETPISANPMSPAQLQASMVFPSTMTATPPMSAGAIDATSRAFPFNPADIQDHMAPSSPAQARRRAMYSTFGPKAPYSRIKGLRGILRNSPLPPSSAISPISPRRQSLRLQEKAARRVGYQSPLEQTITTQRYTRSHIDLLVEEASPFSPNPNVADSDVMLDITMAYTGDETRDGGQTPGPFEEMRRRMAGMATETPVLSPRAGSGVGKRKKKDKKRRWVWTIGNSEEGSEEGGALAAIRAATTSSSPAPGASASTSENTTLGKVSTYGEDATTPRTSYAHYSAKSTTPEPLTAVQHPSLPQIITTAHVPTTIQISVEDADSVSEISSTEPSLDVEMSDASSSVLSSRATTPFSTDGLDLITPIVKCGGVPSFSSPARRILERLGSADIANSNPGTRRDTPIPEELIMSNSS
ncbi:uncharacterized protein B0I36DRAFT_426906 [Microdochium trichocladiopsis]|uniref:Glucan 4-alpha-glucosidase n=1 Tax=Microdochium trichocladiopsis TaxID=1682393 RepID=A0A9P8YI65_9PEZI|nr:uncharacterized protein B0I36DRAFT_426906 [Microdochium trichocladiopsis]KAH7040463.1 hypothetical protein B0I36DRAFT_426906 [Microdochium trichocladiopsis]